VASLANVFLPVVGVVTSLLQCLLSNVQRDRDAATKAVHHETVHNFAFGVGAQLIYSGLSFRVRPSIQGHVRVRDRRVLLRHGGNGVGGRTGMGTDGQLSS
jgi:hypothetical protein